MCEIRLRASSDDEQIIAFSLRAWEPNFASMHDVLGDRLYCVLYPDWRNQQEEAIREVLQEPANHTWVAVNGQTPVGFVSAVAHEGQDAGEIVMLAVDPEAQGQGIGRALTERAVEWMRSIPVQLAVVETAGDSSHAAARAVYAASGFTQLPIARYFQGL